MFPIPFFGIWSVTLSVFTWAQTPEEHAVA
jgi:hypothetical protein